MKNPSVNPNTAALSLDEYGDPQRIIGVFNQFILLIILGFGAGIAYEFSKNDVFAAILLGICMAPLLASLYFIRRKRFELTATVLAVVLISLITVVATNRQGIHQVSVLAYPAVLIVASLVIRKRIMVLLTLFNIACAAWLIFGELSGAYTPDPPAQPTAGDFFIIALILSSTAFMVRLLTEALFQNNLRLQKELRERKLAEEKYRNIFDNAIDGIFQSTTDGRFVSVNPAMARMYGYDSPEEMVRKVTNISSQLYVESNMRETLRCLLDEGKQVIGLITLHS